MGTEQTETQSQSCEGTFQCRANAHSYTAPTITHPPPPPPPKEETLILLNIAYENTLSHEAFMGTENLFNSG